MSEAARSTMDGRVGRAVAVGEMVTKPSRADSVRATVASVVKGMVVGAGAMILAEIFWRIYRSIVAYFNQRAQLRLKAAANRHGAQYGAPVGNSLDPETTSELFGRDVLLTLPSLQSLEAVDVDRRFLATVRLATPSEVLKRDYLEGSVATPAEIRMMNAKLEQIGSKPVVTRKTPMQGVISFASTEDGKQLGDTLFFLFIYADTCGYCHKAVAHVVEFAKAHPDVPIVLIRDDRLSSSNLSRVVNAVPMLYAHKPGHDAMTCLPTVERSAMESALATFRAEQASV